MVRIHARYSVRLGEVGPIGRRTANDSTLVPPWAEVCRYLRHLLHTRPLATDAYGGSVSRSLHLFAEAFLQASFHSHSGELLGITKQRATGSGLRDSPDPLVSLESNSIAFYRL